MIRAGVIGLGVGQRHAEAYSRHPEVELRSLCDLDSEKLKTAQELFPQATLTTNAMTLLRDPQLDVISIASYDDAHFEQIILALDNDKHVFVEKPVCLFAHEAAAIRAKLREKPALRFSSNLLLRNSPRFQWLRQQLKDGLFGTPFYLEGAYDYGRIEKLTQGWRGRLPFYSIVLGGGVHLLDLFQWLSGDKVAEVMAYGNHKVTQGSAFRYPDLVAALLKFESGMVGRLTCNFGGVCPHFHELCL